MKKQYLDQLDRIPAKNMDARNNAIACKKARLANQQAKRSSLNPLI